MDFSIFFLFYLCCFIQMGRSKRQITLSLIQLLNVNFTYRCCNRHINICSWFATEMHALSQLGFTRKWILTHAKTHKMKVQRKYCYIYNNPVFPAKPLHSLESSETTKHWTNANILMYTYSQHKKKNAAINKTMVHPQLVQMDSGFKSCTPDRYQHASNLWDHDQVCNVRDQGTRLFSP